MTNSSKRKIVELIIYSHEVTKNRPLIGLIFTDWLKLQGFLISKDFIILFLSAILVVLRKIRVDQFNQSNQWSIS